MDYQKLLNVAGHKKEEAKYEASMKRYSTSFGPSTKHPKSNVQSMAVKHFLAKRQAEEQQKAEDAKKKREELLNLRAQNSKNNKKAKIMASRTKDNDFSRIKLTDDEIEAKKKREAELLRMSLKNTVERMKARIDLEEKEKLLPKKRKRKSKHGGEERVEVERNIMEDYDARTADRCQSDSRGKDPKKKFMPKPPSEPGMSFEDILKVAAKRQFEPIVVPKKVVVEGRPMTKKEKRIQMEEIERLNRKNAPQSASNSAAAKRTSNDTASKLNGIKIPKIVKSSPSNSGTIKQPTVVHVQKDSKSQPKPSSSSLNAKSVTSNQPGQTKKPWPATASQKPHSGSTLNSNSKNKVPAGYSGDSRKPAPPKPEKQNLPSSSSKKNIESGKKAKSDVAKKEKDVPAGGLSGGISEELLAIIEKRVRSQVQQEMEAKFKSHSTPSSGSTKEPTPKSQPSEIRTSETKKIVKGPIPPSGKSNQKVATKNSTPGPQNSSFKADAMKKTPMPPEKKVLSKPPVMKDRKPVFHPNPYLQPPRRLLESKRPIKFMKRRMESDDDDDDEDDMSDFIDDTCHEGLDDYSKHIKEIFGYDRSRYLDEDDDDIIESSFAEQMKEEVRSAKLGLIEDLEDIKKEEEEMRRKKMKKNRKK